MELIPAELMLWMMMMVLFLLVSPLQFRRVLGMEVHVHWRDARC